MSKTPYRRAVLFERVQTAIFLGIGASALLCHFDSIFVLAFILLLFLIIFVSIWYGLLTCPVCGRPVSWRRSRFEPLTRRCRSCGADLDR
jgi:hypothetical protein